MRIEVTCPECGHSQAEPSLVISTQCRSCRANFRVEHGKGIPRHRPGVKVGGAPRPAPAETKASPAARTPSSATAPSKTNWLARFFPQAAAPSREVRCFSCKHRFHIVRDAHSTQCPKCSHYIAMADFDIADTWVRRIETGGNVVIRKMGRVHGAMIRCHDLTVLGEMTGSVECSGNFIIRNHSRIIGSVHCDALRVEKGAKVEFLHPVHAASVSIDGEVRGQIMCTGPVVLEKRARLNGLVRTSSLVVKKGAVHSGTIEMENKDTSPT